MCDVLVFMYSTNYNTNHEEYPLIVIVFGFIDILPAIIHMDTNYRHTGIGKK